VLELTAVRKDFGSRRVLDDLNLRIPDGQLVGVIGRSGAGKSTLLRLINRLVDPTDGRIRYDDLDVADLNGKALRRWRGRCAMIFQQFNLVNRLDVLTNVLIGRLSYHSTVPTLFKHFSAAERVLAIRALDRLDMAQAALQRAETLSGGQQQRVAIARALMQEPRVLLADEPIASLDPQNSKVVMDALRTINREDGITVIVNLHALDIARTYCDRLIGLAHGRVVFDGAPDQLTQAVEREIYGDMGPAEWMPGPVAQPASEALPAIS